MLLAENWITTVETSEMNTLISYLLPLFGFSLIILFIVTSDLSVVNYMKITFGRVNQPPFLQNEREMKFGDAIVGLGNGRFEGTKFITI